MWNLEDKSLFRSGAMGALRGNHNIDAPEMFLDTAISNFMPNEEQTPVMEIMRFVEFIKDVVYKVTTFPAHELTVALQFPAGDGTIGVSQRASILQFNKEGETIETEQASIDVTAVKMLKSLMQNYTALQAAAGALAAAPSAGNPKSDGADDAPTLEEHEADTLEVGEWKGKKTYRIRAGWFSQYGAAVYPETLKACGYGSIVDAPLGSREFKHHIQVAVKDGKPKVVKIS
jgi:hypothetical protein